MDLTINNSTVKTPEAESETPTRTQPIVKPFTNGVLKRHAPPFLHHHHPVVITYKECLKNHAATLGGHAVDGCGEFMPAPASNPSDPTSLKCAACGCHRNFHRREPDDQSLQLPAPNSLPALEYQPLHRHHPPMPRGNNSNNSTSPNNSPSPPPISSAYYPSAPHMLLALSHGPASAPTVEGAVAAPGSGGGAGSGTQIFTNSGSGRKRFRTKFSSEQKEKMLEFADRVGWKMQKRDEDLISGFCGEIGVDKGVFKVWMHNNKNNFGKKDLQDTPPSILPNGNHNNGIAVSSTTPTSVGINGSSGGIGYGYAGNREVKENNFHGLEIGVHHPHHHSHQHVLGTTNGSSSSS